MTTLSLTRTINSTPAKVWDVMTNRQDEWWCPAPWRAEVNVQERRAGGRSSITMYGSGGEVMPNEGIFLAWEEGKRFVVTDAFDGDLNPQGPFMVGTWEIAPEGDGTRYTATARHWSEEDCKRHKEMGFEQGWGACADQLQALCESA